MSPGHPAIIPIPDHQTKFPQLSNFATDVVVIGIIWTIIVFVGFPYALLFSALSDPFYPETNF